MTRLRLLAGISLFWLPISAVFDGMNTLVLPARIASFADESSRATLLGLATTVGILAATLTQPFVGAYSDRLRARTGRRGIVTAGALLMIAALAVFASAPDLLLVLAAYVLVLAATSVAQAGQQGFIPDLVRRERRGVASGAKGLMDIGGALVAFALVGALLAGGDVAPAVAALAAVVTVALGLTLALVRETPAQELGSTRPAGLSHAFRVDVRAHPELARVVLSRFLFLLGTYAVGRFFLFFVADRLGIDAAHAGDEAGGLLAALTLITAVAALPLGWAADRIGRLPLLYAGAVASGSGAGLLLFAGDATTILLFGSLMAAGSAAFVAANWALTADLVPRGEAARFFALANIGTGAAAALAGLFGPLMDALNAAASGAGYTVLFSGAAVAFAASAVALTGIRSRPARERAAEGAF